MSQASIDEEFKRMTTAIRTRSSQGWRIARWGLIAAILATPAIAMRFTDEVQWTTFDFVFMGALLGGAALLYEVALRLTPNPLHRMLAGAVIVGAVLLIWVEGAVGIFH